MTKVQKGSKTVDTDHLLSVLDVESVASDTNFYKRSPQKITATALMKGFWEMQQQGKNSLRSWAIQVGKIIKDSVTKQSIDNRLSECGVELFKELLKQALNISLPENWLSSQKKELGSVLDLFNRILIQDSTIQKLPKNVYEQFGGNTTKEGNCALMRIQAVFDFKPECWENFSVDTYSKNDQSQAFWGIDEFQPKDLIIRDLGYFVLDALDQIIDNQYVISSYKFGVHLYDQSDTQIDLLKLLKAKQEVDMIVLVGKDKKIPMRLVAKKLPAKQKKRRVAEAKKKRKNQYRKNYSKEYYDLLGYEIFLTNVPPSLLDITIISKLYGLRWYIEILFKSWKSYFNFRAIFEKNQMSYHRILMSVYLVLIGFVYINNYLYCYINEQVKKQSEKKISILKFMDVVNDLFSIIINIKALTDLDSLIAHFIKHAVYEQRDDRKNMKEKYEYLNNLKLEDIT